MTTIRSFKLTPTFLDEYRGAQPEWGPVGLVTYKRTYARTLPDGSLEDFWQTCQRVVEGCYTIQKEHCRTLKLPWDNSKSQRSAQEMFRRMWEFKWLPPGRGLWMMGVDHVDTVGSAALNNCGMVSTAGIKEDLADPFVWMMDMLMLGVGVGFDTKGAGLVKIQTPKYTSEPFVVEDSREGWVSLLGACIRPYSGRGSVPSIIDYVKVRPEGSPINGFGGTASGPAPLIELVDSVTSILDDRVGQSITSTDIVDICNLIGRCVVAGNVRRSAEIAFGDPEDLDFTNLKNPEVAGDKLTHHRWASNNSILAYVGMDYERHAAGSAVNGEPGYEWLDNARAYGRMGREPDYKDRKAAGGNPCVSAETWIHTIEGPRKVRDLVGKQFVALVNGSPYTSGPKGFWKTGRKQTYTITTKKGYSLDVTDNHQLLTVPKGASKSQWIPLSNIELGDSLLLSNHRSNNHWGELAPGRHGGSEGYVLGLLLGDGTLTSRAVLSVWEKDGPGISGVMEAVCKSFESLTTRSDWKGWTLVEGRGEYRLNSTALRDLAAEYGMVQGDKIPDFDVLEAQNSAFCAAFLRGLYDADGSVQGDQSKGVSVRLTQVSLSTLHAVQRMLLRFGVVSTLYKNRQPAREATWPDGKGGKALYSCQAVHELVVSCDNLSVFADVIGFSHQDKQEALSVALHNYKRNPNRELFQDSVVSIEFSRGEDVYDAEIAEVHRFDANGIIAHNCLEQTLEDRELCCLVETFPSLHENYEDYEKTLKYAYLYAKSVTLVPTHNERTNTVMQRNRRIGTSMSGIVQAMQRHGTRKFFNWCDTGYNYLRKLDETYSDWLCIRQSIKITSVKPSGTVSLLPGVSPGIHYPHSAFYIRRIRFQHNSPLVADLRKNGYVVEDDTYSPNTVCVSFPIKENFFDRSKNDVSMWEQLELAAQMQQYWVDNQVSVTVTFRPEEAPSLKRALELYETRLKGVSFLPLTEHGYVQAPLEEITEEVYESMVSSITPLTSLSTAVHEKTERFCTNDTCEV